MEKYIIDYDGLTTYLKTLKSSEFHNLGRDVDNSNERIKACHFDDEIETFKMDKSKITLDTVIFAGMPYLVDAIGSDLSICIKTNRAYKLPTGRVVKCKFDRTLISDCHKQYGTALNGCWVIPADFIKEIK